MESMSSHRLFASPRHIAEVRPFVIEKCAAWTRLAGDTTILPQRALEKAILEHILDTLRWSNHPLKVLRANVHEDLPGPSNRIPIPLVCAASRAGLMHQLQEQRWDLMAPTGPIAGLLGSPLARLAYVPRRSRPVIRELWRNAKASARWVFLSREATNYTYHLTDRNIDYLAQTVAVVTQQAVDLTTSYIQEGLNDQELKQHVVSQTIESPYRYTADPECRLARRLGWYAIARAIKPRVIVETGVDKGLGAVTLCAALLRNGKDGFPGHYFGTDINPRAGWLLSGPYKSVGTVLYGDSIATLRTLDPGIDLFINDSDHSEQYEYDEYVAIAPKLSPEAVILGDNSHVTSALSRFSKEMGRQFLYFSEQPRDHWYRGAGIGISYRLGSRSARRSRIEEASSCLATDHPDSALDLVKT